MVKHIVFSPERCCLQSCTTAPHRPQEGQRVWGSACTFGEGSSAAQCAARICCRCRDRAGLLTSFFHAVGLTAGDSPCLLLRAPVSALSCAIISGLAALSLKAKINPFFSQFSVWNQQSAAVQICKAQLNIWSSYPQARAIPPPEWGYPKVFYGGRATLSFPMASLIFCKLFLAATAHWTNDIGQLSQLNPALPSPSSASAEMAQIVSPHIHYGQLHQCSDLPIHTDFWDPSEVPCCCDGIWLPGRPELFPLTPAVLWAKGWALEELTPLWPLDHQFLLLRNSRQILHHNYFFFFSIKS